MVTITALLGQHLNRCDWVVRGVHKLPQRVPVGKDFNDPKTIKTERLPFSSHGCRLRVTLQVKFYVVRDS